MNEVCLCPQHPEPGGLEVVGVLETLDPSFVPQMFRISLDQWQKTIKWFCWGLSELPWRSMDTPRNLKLAPLCSPSPLMQNGCSSDTGTWCKIRELSNSIIAALAEPNAVCGHPKSRMSTWSPQRNKLWRFGLQGEADVLDEGDRCLCSAGYCELMNVYPPTQVSPECPQGYRYILGSMRQQVLQIWASGAHAAASGPAVRPMQRSAARERS